MITFAVIFVMLLWVYRSLITVVFKFAMVLCEVASARGVVGAGAHHTESALSVYSTNLLVLSPFTGNKEFLKEYYPILKGTAKFTWISW